MSYKYYDVLTHLVPGFLIYIILLYLFEIGFFKIPILPATALAYIIGYLNNSISSWFEPLIYWTWGGKPSSNLLHGKGTFKVKFYESNKIKEKIKIEEGSEIVSDDKMFAYAYRKVLNNEQKSRVLDFSASYTFSRGIFSASLISTILFFSLADSSIILSIIVIIILLAFWYRSKERAYYFSREVLNSYLSI